MEGAGVHLPYYCNVDEGYNHCWHFYKTRSQLTRFFFLSEREGEGGVREDAREAQEKNKERQTDRPTG